MNLLNLLNIIQSNQLINIYKGDETIIYNKTVYECKS